MRCHGFPHRLCAHAQERCLKPKDLLLRAGRIEVTSRTGLALPLRSPPNDRKGLFPELHDRHHLPETDEDVLALVVGVSHCPQYGSRTCQRHPACSLSLPSCSVSLTSILMPSS